MTQNTHKLEDWSFTWHFWDTIAAAVLGGKSQWDSRSVQCLRIPFHDVEENILMYLEGSHGTEQFTVSIPCKREHSWAMLNWSIVSSCTPPPQPASVVEVNIRVIWQLRASHRAPKGSSCICIKRRGGCHQSLMSWTVIIRGGRTRCWLVGEKSCFNALGFYLVMILVTFSDLIPLLHIVK